MSLPRLKGTMYSCIHLGIQIKIEVNLLIHFPTTILIYKESDFQRLLRFNKAPLPRVNIPKR